VIEQDFITLPYGLERQAPVFEGNDIKTPESLVRYFVKAFTLPGERVFDPFAGLGTTLFVAEEMRRIPYGVEIDDRRHQWVAGQLKHWANLVHGDSGRLASMGFAKMDFAMTSPPYMPRHHTVNPLYGGDPTQRGYDGYLRRMRHIFRQLALLMKRNGVVVVQVDNMHGRTYTPLVRDLSLAISPVLRLKREIIVAWEGGRKDYRHTHCLVFKSCGDPHLPLKK
jgi:tRNA G10  N-methylase Trm11